MDDVSSKQNDTLQDGVMTSDSYVILLVLVLVIIANILILLVYLKTDAMNPQYINKYFFLSMTVSDLCLGVLVIPFSFWTSRYGRWVFGNFLCHVQAYLAALFWIVSVYSLMWMSVDHFLALRKEDRYENIVTPMKSKCWTAFVWIGAVFYCFPPLLGVANALYYVEANICMADWRLQRAYCITSGVLISVPPVIAIIGTNGYIFTQGFKEHASIFEKSSSLNSRPDAYIRNLIIVVVYLFAWLPWLSIQLYDMTTNSHVSNTHRTVHFYAMWVAIGNSAYKFFIYVSSDHDFRTGLKIVYSKYCFCRCPWSADRMRYVNNK